LIGRHVDCDVRIESAKVSRRHCCVATAYDRVLIRDLGSRNGVRVNGRLLEESRLHPGDELAIGPILFRLEHEEEHPAGPRPVAAPAKERPAPAKGPQKGRPPLASARPPDSDADLVPLDDI
jgi:pSer/pThr/pTyr-binding forkhead associated (FHA) protein